MYCYLGGGGLPAANTWLAQVLVVKCKSWVAAHSVVTAVTLLSACCPGDTNALDRKLVTTESELGTPDLFADNDEDNTVPLLNTADDVGQNFVDQAVDSTHMVLSKLGLPNHWPWTISGLGTTEAIAAYNFILLRSSLDGLAAGRSMSDFLNVPNPKPVNPQP